MRYALLLNRCELGFERGVPSSTIADRLSWKPQSALRLNRAIEDAAHRRESFVFGCPFTLRA